jgi:hypothetical protein
MAAGSCSSLDSACSAVEFVNSRPLLASLPVIVDTVRYPAESGEPSQSDEWPVRGTGVVVCYSGLLHGFGGNRSRILLNHVRQVIAPLSRLFPDETHVLFSTAFDSVYGKESHANLPDAVFDALTNSGIAPSLVHTERRPHDDMAFKSMHKQYIGIEHCGRMIRARQQMRGRPFAFAVRMRYDVLLDERASLEAWPIWDSKNPRASPVTALTKYVLANTTRPASRGMNLHGCPWQLPSFRCVPQDVLFVVRHTAALGHVEDIFLSSHRETFMFSSPILSARRHVPEATLFHLPLSRGVPFDLLRHTNGHCLWMIQDGFVRNLFARRCALLRRQNIA